MDIKNYFNSIDVPAEWIGLRQVSTDIRYFNARNGNIEIASENSDNGIMVEILVDGGFGYAATNNLETESVVEASQSAFKIAKASARNSVFNFSKKIRPNYTDYISNSSSKPLDEIDTKIATNILIQACRKLLESNSTVSSNTFMSLINKRVLFASSEGGCIDQPFNYVNSGISVTAQKGSVIQTRTDNGSWSHCFQGGSELISSEDFDKRSHKAREECIELLSADECPSETGELILMPDQMMLQIHESIGHPLEIDRILGDERNYAGHSFVNLKDFGILKYGSSLLNATFDPAVPGELATYAYDDAGAKAEKVFLIKDGILKRGLGGVDSGARSGLPFLANFRTQSWNRAPIDRIGNINVEPGESSIEDIIQSTKRGVVMHSNRSWSIDDYRRKFQFGCEYGKLIENGKVVKTVRNPNYRGETLSFWNNLVAVGSKDTLEFFGTPFCGKGEPNQIIRVGHASPVCKFNNIEYFGGA